MTNEVKDKICSKCKRRKYFDRIFGIKFDWRDCKIKCNKKCAKQLKEQKNE